MNETFWTYDLEIYPNFFSAGFTNMATGERLIFEISERINNVVELWAFLQMARDNAHTHIGYNNLRFDYPIIHEFMEICGLGRWPTYIDLYNKTQAIIDAPFNSWTHQVWESDHFIQQIDLMAQNNYGSFARSTSLKKLEIAMRSASVVDLPYPPGFPLPHAQAMTETIDYMCWDIDQTAKFARETWYNTEFRQELDGKLGGRTRVNQTDVKIGINFLIDKLHQRGVQTKQGRDTKQTTYPSGVRVADILLPVEFDNAGLQAIYDKFKTLTVYEDSLKGLFTGMTAQVGGLSLDFGMGGLHGAVPSTTYTAGPGRRIQLRDVESYYPRICAVNGWYPEHLGTQFVEVYDELFWERKKHAKGTPENTAIKLSLNSAFGNMGSKYSPLRDLACMLRITINGQLLLARLAEVLDSRIESLTLIQCNTDGVAYICDEADVPNADAMCQWWMDWTGLKLGVEEYQTFAQRDVNNYTAIEPGGKVKFKGAYNPSPDYHQNHSSLVVQKAVAAYVVDGVPLQDTIYSHKDAYDFCLSFKAKRSDTLLWGDEKVQGTSRYYICLPSMGDELTKVLPPLAGQHEDRRIGINTGWSVILANDMRDFDWSALNRRWYLEEAKALAAGLTGGAIKSTTGGKNIRASYEKTMITAFVKSCGPQGTTKDAILEYWRGQLPAIRADYGLSTKEQDALDQTGVLITTEPASWYSQRIGTLVAGKDQVLANLPGGRVIHVDFFALQC